MRHLGFPANSQKRIFTFFMISVRSPSSGVGGNGRFGGPGGNCGGVDGAASSLSALKPGLYEIGLRNQKQIAREDNSGVAGRRRTKLGGRPK